MKTRDKIKAIRKMVGKTQAAFGEPLGVSGSLISAIETGHKPATDRLIGDIIRVYKINRAWWETETGSMTIDSNHAAEARPELPLHHEMLIKLFDAVDQETQDEVMQLLLKKSRKP